jgi:hypothetical protein
MIDFEKVFRDENPIPDRAEFFKDSAMKSEAKNRKLLIMLKNMCNHIVEFGGCDGYCTYFDVCDKLYGKRSPINEEEFMKIFKFEHE